MKKTFIVLCAAIACVACNKEKQVADVVAGDKEIVFTVDGDLKTEVITKVAAVTSLSSFYVGATTGTAGSEATVSGFSNTNFSGSTSYKGGKYWPKTNPSYHFYASNSSLTFAASGTTVTPNGTVDVVCAYLPNPAFQTSNMLTFDHIYARIGTVSVSPAAGAGNLSNVSATLKNVATGGTYNIRTGAGKNDGTGWTPTSPANKSLTVGSNDIYVVPGTYTLSVTYTITNGDYSDTLTKEGSVTLKKGKINNISATAPDTSTEIEFTVTVTPWGDPVNVPVTLG